MYVICAVYARIPALALWQATEHVLQPGTAWTCASSSLHYTLKPGITQLIDACCCVCICSVAKL
jgi:hypothetical protein